VIFLERLIAELFLLMRGVQTLSRLAHPESLDGFRQYHGGRAFVSDGGGIGRVHLLRIMAAAVQTPNFLVRHVGDHLLELRVFAEEMLARVGAALGLEVLVFAVHALFHQALEQTLLIAFEQRIPARTPQHFDHIPARAQKCRFEFLNDLAVAAHRTVEPL
jgi:hypothetical protein